MSLSDEADDDDDKTVIVQLERIEGGYIHTSWPTCPFERDDVSRINNENFRCTMTYMCQSNSRDTISEPRVTSVVYIQSDNIGTFVNKIRVEIGRIWKCI